VNSNRQIKIVYEDKSLVVVDKPAGTVVNNSQTSREETVQKWFAATYKIHFSADADSEFAQKGGVVHRLDKDTSGLLVLAKNPTSYENLKSQFLNRKVNKTYIALVHGEVDPEQGIISLPITRNPEVWGKFTVGGDLARTAVTEWQRIANYKSGIENDDEKYSMLELKPLTGRTHQLRVHLKHLGYPIVSDLMYLGRRQSDKDLKWCPRMWLHAKKLSLKHPVFEKTMDFECPIPADLATALEKLVHL
jgi:23S rRNA pseudouridine1911/1915/1917 synthase